MNNHHYNSLICSGSWYNYNLQAICKLNNTNFLIMLNNFSKQKKRIFTWVSLQFFA
jgi:hypothetical protein